MALRHVPISSLAPQRFKAILDAEQAAALDELIALGEEVLHGTVVWNVNSTARGGGVAEMLWSLIAYARGAGVDARWEVIEGDPEFFRVTKRIHNRLHGADGDGGPLGDAEHEAYEATCRRNAGELTRRIRPDDVVICHDPQTAGLIAPLLERGAHVVWRCHVGVDLAGEHAREAWRFLLRYVQPAEAYVFSREAYVWDDLDRSRAVVIPPSIDAFSPKNQELDADTVTSILRRAGIEPGPVVNHTTFERQDGTRGRVDRRAELHDSGPIPADVPLLVQVSRWDRLKDHAGVLHAFATSIAPRTEAHLALVGPATTAVADDPEGAEVLAEIIAAWAALADDVRTRVHLISLPMDDAGENAVMVNAIQRRATVIAQKSLAEGFGLTVAEAMWKGRPVVASRVGGIRDQIDDGRTGVLVEPQDLDGFADAVVGLLADPDRAQRVGAAAHDTVRDAFLGPRHLTQYLELCARLLAGQAPAPPQ